MEADDIAHDQHPRPPPQEPQAQHPDRELFPFLTDEFIDNLSDAEAKSWLCCLHSSIRRTTSIGERRDALKFWRDFARRGEDNLTEQKQEIEKMKLEIGKLKQEIEEQKRELAEKREEEAAKKETAGPSVSYMIKSMINNGGGSIVPIQSGETVSLTDTSFHGAPSQHAARGFPVAQHDMAVYRPQYVPSAHIRADGIHHAQPPANPNPVASQAPIHAQYPPQFAGHPHQAGPHGQALMHAQHPQHHGGYQNQAVHYGYAPWNVNPPHPVAGQQNSAVAHGQAPINAQYPQDQFAGHQNPAVAHGPAHAQRIVNPPPPVIGQQNQVAPRGPTAQGNANPPLQVAPRSNQAPAHGGAHGNANRFPLPPVAQGSPAASMDISGGDNGRPNNGGGDPMES